MAYHKHDPTEMDYHGADHDSPGHFFEEEERKYSSGKYDSKDGPFKAGYKTKEEEEEKRNKELTGFEKQLQEEQKPKYDKDKVDDEFIKRKAAEEIQREIGSHNPEEISKKKKTKSSIEEAIEKAVKEEKEVIRLGR